MNLFSWIFIYLKYNFPIWALENKKKRIKLQVTFLKMLCKYGNKKIFNGQINDKMVKKKKKIKQWGKIIINYRDF